MPYLLVHRQADRLLEVGLVAFERGAAHDLAFGRQIGFDLGFAPPQ